MCITGYCSDTMSLMIGNKLRINLCVTKCVCVRAYVRACVRACVRVCVINIF